MTLDVTRATAHIETEAHRFAEALASADPSAAVPTCPDWTADDLLWHLCEVHGFWAAVLRTGVRRDEEIAALEESAEARPGSRKALLSRREQETAALLDQLRRREPSEPAWSWHEPDQTVGFTLRMQTHEATIHRIDAELTAGRALTAIPDWVALDGWGHAVDVMWRPPSWTTIEPARRVLVRSTDTGDELLLDVGTWSGVGPQSGTTYADEPVAVRPGSDDLDATAEVRGTASDLYRWMWRRPAEVVVEGDEPTRAALEAAVAVGMD